MRVLGLTWRPSGSQYAIRCARRGDVGRSERTAPACRRRRGIFLGRARSGPSEAIRPLGVMRPGREGEWLTQRSPGARRGEGTGTRASWVIKKGSTVAGRLELDIPWAVSQAFRTPVHMEYA